MDKPVRILHILQRMEAGGTQALLMNMYRKIDRTKIQFDFLVVYKEKQFYDDEIEELGGHVYKMSFREDLNVLKFKKDLSEFFKTHREYQVVHCHAYTIGYFCLKAAKKAGIPVRIAHSHSNSMTNDRKKYLKRIMQKLFLVYATDNFACSEEAGKFLFKNRKFRVLSNAIDSEKFIADTNIRTIVREELNLTNYFVVGHTGRFRPEKNHKFLIDIFGEIKAKIPNSKLLLIGNSDSCDNIRQYISEKGYTKDVIILTNRGDMNRIYQAMDIFVFPSKYEGLGIVAIEAQASGIPVICSTGVPIETKVTPLYDRKSLEDTAYDWAQSGIQLSKNCMTHTNMQEYIISSGYDIGSMAKEMEDYYLCKVKGGLK